MKIKKYLLPIAAILIFGLTNSFAKFDQGYTERIIKQNREFIDFIDTCVTNFNMDRKKDLLTIYQKHLNAEIAYLQANYKRAYDEIYSSQKDMVELYEYILNEHYFEDSKNMLDGHASDIIKSKNTAAKQYLSLGYRDRAVARSLFVAGDSAHLKLRSYRLFKYMEAINLARRAKRYALISLYASQDGKTKLKIFNRLFKDEQDSSFFKRFVDKGEKDYIAEMNKTYEEYASETGGGEDKSASILTPFEGRAEKRSRFRKESKVAHYLLQEELYKAETIIRSYIDNYNYKLIMATLNVLAETAHEGESDGGPEGKDYKLYINHHKDNYYLLIHDKSALELVARDAKIVDYVKKDEKRSDDQQQIEVPEDSKSGR